MSLTAADDVRAGVKVKRRRYPDGEEGILMSLSEICRLAREGSITAVMRSFAGKILKEAGFPKSIKDKATAILNYVRSHVGYVPDPVGVESIQTAVISLCAPDENGHVAICIPIGDCDDLTTCVLTLLLAAGINAEVVRQFYGDGIQQHVIVEAQDERGNWIPLDPSTSLPAGQKTKAKRETRISPLDDKATGLEGTDKAGAQYIGIGRPLEVWEQDTKSGGWHKHDANKGLGADTPGNTTLPYQQVTNGQIRGGLRYRFGLIVTFPFDPTGECPIEQLARCNHGVARAKTWLTEVFQQERFSIEVLSPLSAARPLTDGYFWQSWLVEAIARQDMQITTTQPTQTNPDATWVNHPDIQIKVIGVQSKVPNPPPPDPQPDPNRDADRAKEEAFTIGPLGVVGIIAGASVVGGVAFWGIKKWREKRARELAGARPVGRLVPEPA
jgi:hypothetical protein